MDAVLLQEVFLTTDFICIAMEYATGGSLFNYVQKQGMLNVGGSGCHSDAIISCWLSDCRSHGIVSSCSSNCGPTAYLFCSCRKPPRDGSSSSSSSAWTTATSGEWPIGTSSEAACGRPEDLTICLTLSTHGMYVCRLENTLLQAVNGLPLPLVKICDFGYSKADSMSVAKSKVGHVSMIAASSHGCWGVLELTPLIGSW